MISSRNSSGLLLQPPKALPSAELQLEEWIIDRPAELNAVITALVHGHSGTVGITTGLYGAGGFGKTTLAKMVCADRRIRRRFGGRVYFFTVGRDARGPDAIAAKINNVIAMITGENATFTDPELAGRRLSSLLAIGPHKLLVVDDLWEPEQLAPFAEGGRRCARLVTTRVPGLLARPSAMVRVDEMSPQQARALLMAGLPSLDPKLVDGLLAVTGRWPLLLRLVNKILADYAQVASDVSTQGTVLLDQLRTGGPAIVDNVLTDSARGLNLDQPQERAQAVRATIEASTSLLDNQAAELFIELGIFAEDETIPFNLVAQLWGASAGVNDLRAAQIWRHLAQLALVSDPTTAPGDGITLHDVVRDFLRVELGKQLADL
jgi:hypothetical protein